MVEAKVANILDNKHAYTTERLNRTRPARKPLTIGTKVWVYKQKQVGGHKLSPRWWGPAIIQARVGESSYIIKWEKETQEVHIDDLKEYEALEFTEEGEDLWFMKGTEGGPIAEKHKTALVEDILDHRPDAYKQTEYLVKWAGWGPEYNTWEPAHRLSRGSGPFLTYCARQGIKLKPLDLMPWRGEETIPAQE
jgi:hypothetical protein